MNTERKTAVLVGLLFIIATVFLFVGGSIHGARDGDGSLADIQGI